MYKGGIDMSYESARTRLINKMKKENNGSTEFTVEQYSRLTKLFDRYHSERNQIEFKWAGYHYWMTWSGRCYRRKIEGVGNNAVRISNQLFMNKYFEHFNIWA